MDYRKLQEKLTDTFIGYQWRLENPLPRPHETEEMILHYQTDVLFHRKVQSLVAGVIHVIQEISDE